jgi:RNA polymerase sigma-70 factor (ECF subfamily)
LLSAAQSWASRGLPDDPRAWLYRVAHNAALDALRRERRPAVTFTTDTEALENATQLGAEQTEPTVYLPNEVPDDSLRMLFVCADPRIPEEAQLVLALRTLCGFSAEEIALRLFQSVEAVHKRLQRARQALREGPFSLETPSASELPKRLPSVLHMLYLLFNEGYSSSQSDQIIRRELCEEAVRLALLLREHPHCVGSELNALLALMYLHAARFEARTDGTGGLLMLEEQDRTRWDPELIGLGTAFLNAAAENFRFCRYYAEAAIAAEHCTAKTYADTRWQQIAELYLFLEQQIPSPLFTLNRAIALSEWQGPKVGLTLLEATKPPGWLLGYYLWDATLGELRRRNGEYQLACEHLTRAYAAAPTAAEKALIWRRLELAQEAT